MSTSEDSHDHWTDDNERLVSFNGQGSPRYSAEELSSAGFYVTDTTGSDSNEVTCFSCKKKHLIEDFSTLHHPLDSKWHELNCSHLLAKRCNQQPTQLDATSRGIEDSVFQSSIYTSLGNMMMETFRLSTFDQFSTVSLIEQKRLAKSGFYLSVDRVKCCACGKEIGQWKEIDDPSDVKWHGTNCPLTRGEECGNVPMQSFFNSDLFHPTISSTVSTVQDANQDDLSRETGRNTEISITSTNRDLDQSTPVANRTQPRSEWKMADVKSILHKQFLMNLFLNRELDRIASFSRWPLPTNRANVAHPVVLAKSGLFYLGDADRTQCFSCGVVSQNWKLNLDVETLHRNHSDDCPMVLGGDTRNVPVHEQHPETEEDKLTRYPCRLPHNAHMKVAKRRLGTFDSRWSAGKINATPTDIANAGFFFLGEGDKVKCWYCSGGLQHWEEDDDPWVEHARFFPNCQFLLRIKGQNFVYGHLLLYPSIDRPVIAKQHISPANVAPARTTDKASGYQDVQEPTLEPMIIIPEERSKRDEKVQEFMEQSDAVKFVLSLGYDKKIIITLLQDQFILGEEANLCMIYDTSAKLLNAVMEKEEEMKKEDEERMNQEKKQELLLRKVKELEEERICKICFQVPANLTFSPCGHMCCCLLCGLSLKDCPICRGKIQSRQRTYIS